MVIDGVLRSLAGGSNPPATSLLSHFLSEESQEGVKDQDREVVEWRTDYISSQRSLVQIQYRPPFKVVQKGNIITTFSFGFLTELLINFRFSLDYAVIVLPYSLINASIPYQTV